MKILVLNAWSSSLKYQLFAMESDVVLAKWIVEKIWMDGSFLNYTHATIEETITMELPSHKEAFKLIIDTLMVPSTGVLTSLNDLHAIGHRVVHGGEYFQDPVIITDEVIHKITLCTDLAPLHNPANLSAILACKEIVPHIPQVAVFDTAFHQTMQPANYLYALPKKYYDQYKVRRYGFHGISHQYVYTTLLEKLRDWEIERLDHWNLDALKVITCHIGNWASIAAIQNGKVIETSMGMTPLEGLMMGTRCGNIDPAIIPYLMKHENMTPDQIDTMLNKYSGLLWVSGVSADMRDIIAGAEQGNLHCETTITMYVNAMVKYIWSYMALLWGVDCIVLTAGVMERSKFIRARLLNRLAWLGIFLDIQANDSVSWITVISTLASKVKVVVIPTNEELMIAKDTYMLMKHTSK